ncbi:MAG: hemolysin family protein [Bacteroidota bacterium]
MEADPDPSLYPNVAFLDVESVALVVTDAMAAFIGTTIVLWLLVAFLASCVRSFSFLNSSSSDLLREKGDTASKRLRKLIAQKNQVLLTLNALLVVATVSFTLFFYLVTNNYLEANTALSLNRRLLLCIVACTLVLLLANKVIPRIIATWSFLTFGRRVSMPVMIIHRIAYPISRPITRWFAAAMGYGSPRIQYLSGDDLKAMADIGEAQGTIEEDEREFIHSIMDFGDTTVREIMISRLDMDALPITASLDDVLYMIRSSGHSRVPLYENHIDNIVGFVYVKDLLPYISSSSGPHEPNWRETVRKPFFVPASKPLDDLLREFQAMKMHIAIVLDEYGGTAGLVTMEDVLEEIVGDIRDEYDQAEAEMHEQIDEFSHRFDARINLDDLRDLLKIELDFESYDFETLGGLIFHLKGEIPGEGDLVEYEAMTMRIESVENHRIGRVFIQIHPPTADKSLVA